MVIAFRGLGLILVWNAEQKRFDHHQKGFMEVFPGGDHAGQMLKVFLCRAPLLSLDHRFLQYIV